MHRLCFPTHWMFRDCDALKARRGAFTLVEILTVVALLSMVATAGLWSLSCAGDSARIREAVSFVREADAFARLQSRRGAAVELRVENARLVVRRNDEELLSRTWPASTLVRVEPLASAADGQSNFGSKAMLPPNAISFDRSGRSIDYAVRVKGTSESVTLVVSGITGVVERVVKGEAPHGESAP